MLIRKLGPSDAAAFQALRLLGLEESPSAFLADVSEESGLPLTVIAERLAPQDDGAVFGSFDADRLVALTGVRREPRARQVHKAHIWGVYVAPSARQRGIARQLMTQVITFAAEELRVRQISLGVNARNPAALALYRSLGFEQFGLERGFMMLDGQLHDEIHMVRVLSP